MSSLLSTLTEMKEKLSLVESSIEEFKKAQENDDDEETRKKKIMDLKLKAFKDKQVNHLKVNVGGKQYSFSNEILNTIQYDNLFKKEIGNTNNFFYDGSPYLFNHIASFIRFVANPNTPSSEVFVVTLRHRDDEFIFKSMFEEVFANSKEEALKRIKITRPAIKEKVLTADTANTGAPVGNNNNDYDNNLFGY